MISLLLGILAFILLSAAVAYLHTKLRDLNGRIESMLEFLTERITALAQEVNALKEIDNLETRKKAQEAEKRFMESFTSILNYDVNVARGKSK